MLEHIVGFFAVTGSFWDIIKWLMVLVLLNRIDDSLSAFVKAYVKNSEKLGA